jgi:tetratricopeptide (TPR) repeat protein/transcriptional regulator with XRE-family HTH domain
MPRNERLRQHRLERNWRQSDIADQLDVSLISVQRWERGIQQPSVYYRAKLCALFGLSAQELGFVDVALPPSLSENNTAEAKQPGGVLSVHRALWTVPYARNPYFTGRDEVLDHLMQLLMPDVPEQPTALRQAALTQLQALTGLGGIGKTQIAVEYAYRAREQEHYTHIFWITAASEEAILNSFTSLVDQLPTIVVREETDQRQLARAIIEWLEQCEEPWLLILDNADDLSLLSSYLPKRGNGSVLLTTRASAVGSLAQPIEVETMGVLEGTQLLLRRAQRRVSATEEEINEASNLVVALAQFPLALDQAGAYIEETGCSVRDYLLLYQQHRQALLARRGRQALGYSESVATTWSLSFEQVAQANAAAAELLRLCALLSPDRIPEELLTLGSAYWPAELQLAVADPLRFNQMLEELLKYSLVKRLSEDRLLSIHRLLQVVQIEMMEPEEQRQWAERVVCAVNLVFPHEPKENIAAWPLCLRYLEQAQACALLIQHYHLQLPEGAELLDRVGVYLAERALYSLAESLFRAALYVWEQQAQPDHAHISSALGNLGDIYREQGQYAEAEAFYWRALSVYEQWVGQEDDQVAYLLQRLAIIFLRQGKYGEAEPLYLQALRIWEQQLGPDHAHVGYPLNGLANLYREQGKYGQAEVLYQRTLRIWEQQLGSEHPYVASVLTNLANLYSRQEWYGQAEVLHLRALRIREQQLGPEHPQLAASIHGLAYVYHGQGQYTQAEALYQRALRIREQQLGPEHPDLFDPLNDLARLFLQQERYEQAEMCYQRAYSILEKQVGPEHDHPDMVSALQGLAKIYAARGKQREAKRFFLRALRIREQQVGTECLDTGLARRC